jgi:7-alpha-hydroxysteroid dehydrogenase
VLDRYRIDDRVAIVTGAGRGIGAATARLFAEAGADVVLAARTREQLEAVADDVRAAGRRALVVPADIADLDSHRPLVDATVAAFGRVDVLVNNVGGAAPAPFLDTSIAALHDACNQSIFIPYSMTQAVVPHMLAAGGGAIVNTSSAMGHLLERGFVAYGTVRAALDQMTRLLALDLAPRIRVNAVAPGAIATSMLELVLTVDELREQMVANTPMKRLGDSDDIAAGVLYLVSDAASYVTGKVLEIDGGIVRPNFSLGLPDIE